MNKYFWVLILLLALLVSVNALGINAQDNIPSGTQWTISIDYSLNSSGEIQIFLNNNPLISAFEHGGKVFVDEAQKSDSILNYNVTLNKITLSLEGMPTGNSIILVRVFSSNNEIDSASKEITFVDLQANVNALENTVSSQAQTINSQSILISDLKKDLNSKENEISDLKKNNAQTLDSIKKINSSISNLQQSDVDKNLSLNKISTDLNKLVEEKQNNTFAGLFSAGFLPPTYLALFVLIALIIVGIVFYNKRKKEKLY
ncbi:MAG: hypothetical protein WCW13_05575 [archaeon]|jgi:hypothetical protein